MPHTAACGRALGVIDLGPEACQYQVGCLAPSPSYMQPLMQLPAIWAGCCLPTHLFVWMPLHCVTNPPHNTCLLHSADEFKSQRHVYRTACVHDLLATEHVLLSNGCFVCSVVAMAICHCPPLLLAVILQLRCCFYPFWKLPRLIQTRSQLSAQPNPHCAGQAILKACIGMVQPESCGTQCFP